MNTLLLENQSVMIDTARAERGTCKIVQSFSPQRSDLASVESKADTKAPFAGEPRMPISAAGRTNGSSAEFCGMRFPALLLTPEAA